MGKLDIMKANAAHLKDAGCWRDSAQIYSIAIPPSAPQFNLVGDLEALKAKYPLLKMLEWVESNWSTKEVFEKFSAEIADYIAEKDLTLS